MNRYAAPASTRIPSSTSATGNQPAAVDSSSAQDGASSAVQEAAEPTAAAPAKPEIPAEYKKYARLIDMGMPAEQVALKMQSEGADPKLLGI